MVSNKCFGFFLMCLIPFHLLHSSHYYELSSSQQPPLIEILQNSPLIPMKDCSYWGVPTWLKGGFKASQWSIHRGEATRSGLMVCLRLYLWLDVVALQRNLVVMSGAIVVVNQYCGRIVAKPGHLQKEGQDHQRPQPPEPQPFLPT